MENFTLTDKLNKKDMSVDIQLNGQLNVANISKIYKSLQKSIKDVKKINFNITSADDADVTLVQLIKSLELHCAENNIEFSKSINLNDDLLQLFVRAGIIIS